MELLIFYFLLAVVVSFVCSILEAVLLSMTPSFVASMKQHKRRSAALLESLKRDVDRPLAAILSLNTISHTAGAAGVGAQAQVIWGDASLTIVSAILTLLILVLSEIIPKTLGATYWRPLAVPSAYVLKFLTAALLPLVWMAMGITRLLASDKPESRINKAEIFAMTMLGREAGILDKTETDAIRGVIAFGNTKVVDVLTPRVVTVIWPSSWTVGDVMTEYETIPYSRVPVSGDSSDEILGYVMKDDVLKAAASDERAKPLSELMRTAIIVPEGVPLKRLFSRFLRQREHIAVVVDEFGGFSGVVTLEDIIETMIGCEIMDEVDEIEDLRQFARDSQLEATVTES